MEETRDLSTEVYHQLKQMILHFNLKPGEKINKKALMVLLEVSSTPVRNALLRLQMEDLVSIVPQSGSYVSLIDLNLLRQIAFIRTGLSEAISETMIANFDEERFGELQNIIAQQQAAHYLSNFDEYFRLEDDMQSLLFRTSGYPRIWDWLKPIQLQNQRIRFLRLELVELNWHEMLTANEALVQAVADKDSREVRRILNRKTESMLEDVELAQKMHSEYFLV